MAGYTTGFGSHPLLTSLLSVTQDDDEPDNGTMINASANDRTLVPSQDFYDGTMIGSRTSEGTMIEHCTGTLVPHGRKSGRTMNDDDLTDNLGTMVINTDEEEEDADSTMKSR